MSVKNLILPPHYFSKLDIMETEVAIKLAKDTFERELAEALSLTRVSAPLFVRPETGLNDDLNGVERPVRFDILELQADVEIVHSLAKWKRMALGRYGFAPGTGLYTDMNAVRRDDAVDNIHSVFVYQWVLGKGDYPGGAVVRDAEVRCSVGDVCAAQNTGCALPPVYCARTVSAGRNPFYYQPGARGPLSGKDAKTAGGRSRRKIWGGVHLADRGGAPIGQAPRWTRARL